MTLPSEGTFSQDIRDLRNSVQSLERSTDAKYDGLTTILADINTKIALLNADRLHHDKWHAQQDQGKDRKEGWYVAIALSIFGNIVAFGIALLNHV